MFSFFAFLALATGFFYEIELLSKTRTKGRNVAIFVYVGLFLFGSLAYLTRSDVININAEIISLAMLIGIISYMVTSWKVNLTQLMPVESSGVIFGMITVFHVIIESIFNGYIMWNTVIAVVMICISISMVYKVNIRTFIFQAVMYCVAISLIRNLEFVVVQHYHAEPFSWMAIMSIPALLMFLKIPNKTCPSNSIDHYAKRLAIIWVIMPPMYHYMIIMVSPTIAAMTVTTGYVFASIARSKSKNRWYAGATSICAMGLVSF